MATKTAKTIVEFEIINHGIDYPDYFPGCGICLTEFDDVATGIGNTEAEAFDDALEQLAQHGYDVDGMEKRAKAQEGKAPGRKPIPKRFGDEAYRYISVRVK